MKSFGIDKYTSHQCCAAVSTGAIIGGAAGGIAGSLIDLGTTAMTNKFNAEQAQISRDWSEKMMEKQNQWNIDQWNRQNAYNAPDAQLERIREAGLNPLFFGLDGTRAEGLTSANVNNVATPQMENPNVGHYFSEILPAIANMKVSESVAEKNAADADLAKAQAEDIRNYSPVKVKLGETEIELMVNKDSRDQEMHVKQLEKTTAEIKSIGDDNIRKWSELGIEQRKQQLEETRFEFDKWIQKEKLSNEQQQIAIAWYNAGSTRLQVETLQKEYELHKDMSEKQKELLNKEIAAKQKELDNYERILNQSLKNQKLDNVNGTINSISGALKTVGWLVSVVMTKGLTGIGSGGNLSSTIEKIGQTPQKFTKEDAPYEPSTSTDPNNIWKYPYTQPNP